MIFRLFVALCLRVFKETMPIKVLDFRNFQECIIGMKIENK